MRKIAYKSRQARNINRRLFFAELLYISVGMGRGVYQAATGIIYAIICGLIALAIDVLIQKVQIGVKNEKKNI